MGEGEGGGGEEVGGGEEGVEGEVLKYEEGHVWAD